MTRSARLYAWVSGLLSVGALALLAYYRWFGNTNTQASEGASAADWARILLVRGLHVMGLPFAVVGMFMMVPTIGYLARWRSLASLDRTAVLFGIIFLCLAVFTPVWLWPSIDCFPARPGGWEIGRMVVLSTLNALMIAGGIIAARKARSTSNS